MNKVNEAVIINRKDPKKKSFFARTKDKIISFFRKTKEKAKRTGIFVVKVFDFIFAAIVLSALGSELLTILVVGIVVYYSLVTAVITGLPVILCLLAAIPLVVLFEYFIIFSKMRYLKQTSEATAI